MWYEREFMFFFFSSQNGDCRCLTNQWSTIFCVLPIFGTLVTLARRIFSYVALKTTQHAILYSTNATVPDLHMIPTHRHNTSVLLQCWELSTSQTSAQWLPFDGHGTNKLEMTLQVSTDATWESLYTLSRFCSPSRTRVDSLWHHVYYSGSWIWIWKVFKWFKKVHKGEHTGSARGHCVDTFSHTRTHTHTKRSACHLFL